MVRNLNLIDDEMHYMITGTIGILQAFLPLIRAGQQKKIVVISTLLGSIESALHMPGLNDIYSVSRAALNMIVRKWGAVLKMEGITAVAVNPGKSGIPCIVLRHPKDKTLINL